MGYTKDRSGFTRVKEYLDQLLEAKGPVSWEFENANSAAWAMRNGIKVAQASEDSELEKYAVLDQKFVFRVKGLTLTAVPRGKLHQAGILIIPGVVDGFGVIQEMVSRPETPVVKFPNVNQVPDYLAIWCNTNNYSCVLDNDGIMMRKIS